MTGAPDTVRWGGALAVVLALHAGAVAGVLAWESHAPPVAPPPAAMMIELAPLPTPSQEARAPEKQNTVEKRQPKKSDPPPKPAAVKMAEVALNATREKPPETPPEKDRTKVEEAGAPPSAPPPADTAAPARGASIAPPSNAVPTWQGTVLAHLERHKRYPRGAQLRRQQGVAHVAFTIDRQGNVLAQRLHRSSGHDSLDDETLDLIQRAQPLPPPPPEVAGERIDLVVPVQFFLR